MPTTARIVTTCQNLAGGPTVDDTRERVLAVGRIGEFGPHLQPRDAFPPMVQTWLGRSHYAGEVELHRALGAAGRVEQLRVELDAIEPFHGMS